MSLPASFACDLNFLRRIETACDQFKATWKNGSQPDWEDHLASFNPEERVVVQGVLMQLLQELLQANLSASETAVSVNVEPAQQLANAPEVQPLTPAPALQPPSAPVSKQSPFTEAKSLVKIEVLNGPHIQQFFEYTDHNTLLVGRSTQVQLRLRDDRRISRYHFRLEIKPPRCYLIDLKSVNGTFVNGERVSEQFLNDGDVISIGRTKLAVHITGATPTQEASHSSKLGPPTPVAANSQWNLPNDKPLSARDVGISPQQNPLFPSLPGYEFREILGPSQRGYVYRAKQIETGQPCAIKIIPAAPETDPKAIQTFLREVSILGQLNHPHIVRLVEVGQHEGHLFLSTEYVSPLSWQELSASWDFEKRTRIACGLILHILAALSYAHRRGVVHRDVKPANLQISRVNTKLMAKLAEFGLAKQYLNAGMEQITRSGDVVGDLAFMSPEQFIDSRKANPSSDIYSTMATLYWMLVDSPPIDIYNHPCKFLAILEKPPIPLNSHYPDAPVELCEIMERSLDKNPEKRFPSVKELRKKLSRLVGRLRQNR